MKSHESRQRIARADALAEGGTLKFSFQAQGVQREGFLARWKGGWVAYENLCRHIPLTLDYDDNRFFTEDGCHFICRTHGAVYEPREGLCVEGPCQGAKLFKLTVEEKEGEVWMVLPEEGSSAR